MSERESNHRGLPLPNRGPGSTAITLVLLTAAATTIALCGVAIHTWYAEIQRGAERVHPAALEWSASSVRTRIADAQDAVAELARVASSAANDTARDEKIEQVLPDLPILSGVVVLDGEGRVRGAAGQGPTLDYLVSVLTTQRAVDAGIEEAMAAAQLRRELSEVDAGSLRLFSQGGQPPVIVASTLLVDSHRHTRGSIHGLIRPAELSTALHFELLGAGALHLADADGLVIAHAGEGSNMPSALPPETLHAAATPHISVPWDADDSWTVRSATPVEVLGLAIVAEQPIFLAFEPLVVATVQLLATGLVLAIGFSIVAFLTASRMTRHLQALLDGLRSVARLDFATQLPDETVRGQLELVYRSFNEMTSRLEKQANRNHSNLEVLSKQNAGFQKQHDLLAKLSVTDGLTNLHNHRYFQDQLGLEIKRLTRTNEGLSILIIDVDDFKKLNDTYGHAAGDEFLKQLAQILKESVRETDLLARYGGEEFVIVAIGTKLEGAILLGEKLRTRVAETSFIVDETMRPRSVTVSIGLAQFGHSRTELFTAADAALYRAKAAGKNCVVAAEPHPDGDEPQ